MKSGQDRSLPALIRRPIRRHKQSITPLLSHTVLSESFLPPQSLFITGSRIHSRAHQFDVFRKRSSQPKAPDACVSDMNKTIVLLKDSAIDTEIDEVWPVQCVEPLAYSYLRIHQVTSKPDIRRLRFRKYQ